MVLGVFTARWTFPTLLKGTRYVFADLRAKKHLIVWAVLAGSLWAVANTLTVFAVRDVGLAIAFPLWNANALVGLLWGRLLFGELRNAPAWTTIRVIAGAFAIILATVLLAFSTLHGDSSVSPAALRGVIAALGASVLWGSMYVPYMKAYVSGMNPLSFVKVFTVGEVITMLTLVWTLDGGLHSSAFQFARVRPMLFWLFLGGFVWVIGDLLQQFATKYLGIGRGIPLSNTNQLWGLAWAALVFGELRQASAQQRLMVVVGSLIMILGALSISTAVASAKEQTSSRDALKRECDRYGMDYYRVLGEYGGSEFADRTQTRGWWDYVIVAVAVAIFIILSLMAASPAIRMNMHWICAFGFILSFSLAGCSWLLKKHTNFS